MYKKTRMGYSGLNQLTYIQEEARFKAELELYMSHKP
jgi:hypothetical protein